MFQMNAVVHLIPFVTTAARNIGRGYDAQNCQKKAMIYNYHNCMLGSGRAEFVRMGEATFPSFAKLWGENTICNDFNRYILIFNGKIVTNSLGRENRHKQFFLTEWEVITFADIT